MIDFERLLEVLSGAGVDFILVGGVAATVHGSARLTQDIDVVYARTRENLERLVAALGAHGPYLRGAPRGLPFRFDTETLEGGLNFTLTTRLGDIDLLGEMVGGGRYEDLIPHSLEITLFGLPCRCLDLPTLIRVKRSGWTSEGSRCHQRAPSHPGRDFRRRSLDGQVGRPCSPAYPYSRKIVAKRPVADIVTVYGNAIHTMRP